MRAVPRVPPFERPATYEDLVKLPEHRVWLQAGLAGQVREMPQRRGGRPSTWLRALAATR